MDVEEFCSYLDGVKHMPSGIAARCPAHDDHVASLSVNAGKHGGVVVKCHAGCQIEDVLGMIGLGLPDLMGLPCVIATYPYTTDDGHVLYTVERWANPKDFRCRPGLPPAAQRVLYRSDALAWARERGASVWLVEGEKDADRLGELGLVSTTNVTGAGSWLPHYAEQLRGCHVTIVADNDPVGRQHARDVAASVATAAASVVTVVPRYGKDISELLDLGWGLDAVDPLPEDDGLGLIGAANVTVKPVTWAWPGYLPMGKCTIIEGDPGDGKSILTTDLVARWTSGAPMPDGSRHGGPWPCLMISAEDDFEDTVVPRLRAAGADLSLVRLLDHGAIEGRPFDVTRDVPALARIVIEAGIKVITLDPLMALLGDKTDSHNDSAVRGALFPLFKLARDAGVAIVVVRHLNKGSGAKALYRGSGSIGFAGFARAVFTVGRDAENPQLRVVANTKMNVAPQPPSLAYTIEHGSAGAFIEWRGIVDANAQDIVDGVIRSDDLDMIRFLNSVVEDEPLAWQEIVKAARNEGFTDKQLRTRRHRSRLTKIVGHEGRRSTRWGYLDHELETPANPSAPTTPSAPEFPINPYSRTPPDGQTGDMCPPDPLKENGNKGKTGEDGPSPGPMADEDDRIAELESRPLVCDVCGASDKVHRWASPYWVVRCFAHKPTTYRGGQ